MAEPYVGEIRMFSGTFAPDTWLPCDGRTVPISQFETLFALLGTTYGGDGVNTFGVPDLRGRAAMHLAPAHPLGQGGGSETVTLNGAQLAAHTHLAQARTGNGTSSAPAGHYWAGNSDYKIYAQSAPSVQFAANAIGSAGGSQPHDNMMPFTTVTFIIATQGIYPNTN